MSAQYVTVTVSLGSNCFFGNSVCKTSDEEQVSRSLLLNPILWPQKVPGLEGSLLTESLDCLRSQTGQAALGPLFSDTARRADSGRRALLLRCSDD